MISAKSQEIHQERINLALDYIDKHITSDIRLEDVANAAFFSAYHFHRIFSTMMGETPDDYIRRIRLENAANLLWSSSNVSVENIALNCGFSSQSIFSRNFKKHFGLSPLEWRKNEKAFYLSHHQFDLQNTKKNPAIPGLQKITLENSPEKHVVFIRHLTGYYNEIENTFQKLHNWVIAKNLILQDSNFIGISYDNPHITSSSKCRYYACCTVAKEAKGSGNFSTMTIKDGLYARIEYRGPITSIELVYHYFYFVWLPQSGLQADERADYMLFLDGLPDWKADNMNIAIHVGVCAL
jgi:AraC family transcriptional regulator